MMTIRTRTRSVYGPSGLAVRSGVPYAHGPPLESYEECVDDTQPGDNWSFKVTKGTSTGGRCHLAGDHDGVGGYGSFYNFMADGVRGFFIWHQYVPGDKGDIAYSTIAAARTNPSRPNVDVPVEALQLGELTQLIRDVGNNIIRKAGNYNLAYQFGIKPVVDDLFKLTQFREYVSQRVKELERLQSGRGLRRTMALGSLDNLRTEGFGAQGLIQSVYRDFYGDQYHYRTQLEIGAHVRWKPNLTSYPKTNEAMHALAKRAVLGLTVDLSTWWELMPWSWMIDWGSTCGAFFAAKRNIVQAYPSEISVLRRTRTMYHTDGYTYHVDGYDRVFDSFDSTLETKERNRTDVVAPDAYFPFLTGNQMGIVASLAVTRG